MRTLYQSATYTKWFDRLRSEETKALIRARVFRACMGNEGDIKSVGGGVSEMRIHTAGGIRIYFMRRGEEVIILLAGGDKSSQARDIAKAKEIASHWE